MPGEKHGPLAERLFFFPAGKGCAGEHFLFYSPDSVSPAGGSGEGVFPELVFLDVRNVRCEPVPSGDRKPRRTAISQVVRRSVAGIGVGRRGTCFSRALHSGRGTPCSAFCGRGRRGSSGPCCADPAGRRETASGQFSGAAVPVFIKEGYQFRQRYIKPFRQLFQRGEGWGGRGSSFQFLQILIVNACSLGEFFLCQFPGMAQLFQFFGKEKINFRH